MCAFSLFLSLSAIIFLLFNHFLFLKWLFSLFNANFPAFIPFIILVCFLFSPCLLLCQFWCIFHCLHLSSLCFPLFYGAFQLRCLLFHHYNSVFPSIMIYSFLPFPLCFYFLCLFLSSCFLTVSFFLILFSNSFSTHNFLLTPTSTFHLLPLPPFAIFTSFLRLCFLSLFSMLFSSSLTHSFWLPLPFPIILLYLFFPFFLSFYFLIFLLAIFSTPLKTHLHFLSPLYFVFIFFFLPLNIYACSLFP